MSEGSTISANELLRSFLAAPSEAESAKFLGRLMEIYALPTIGKILRTKFGDGSTNNARFSRQNYEDLYGECCVKIVGVLRFQKIAADAPPIEDFSAYCATIVYNVWNSYVRECSPKRESLKNKIRYSLDKDDRFGMRMSDDGKKFYHLQTQIVQRATISTATLTGIVKDEYKFFARAHLPDLLVVILEKADGGLKLDEILKIVAALWQISDSSHLSLDELYKSSEPANFRRENFEMRCKLEYLWLEIRALPILQRVALLYNLRDERGGEMLLSFFNTRLASFEELAEAMNLTKTQFVKLLPHLPFNDKKIAAAMNLTVKQVGNLRKTARDNLRRRLDGKARRKSAAKNEEMEFFTFIGDDEDGAAVEFIN